MRTFDFPIREPYQKTQDYGQNLLNYQSIGLQFHNGLDYACPTGTALYAVADGIVTMAIGNVPENNHAGYGNLIGLLCPTDEANKYYDVIYGHLLGTEVKTGDTVSKGQLIGFVNNTGFSTGPHLHFGVRYAVKKTPEGTNEGSRTYLDTQYAIPNYQNGVYGYVDPLPLFQDEPGKEVFPVDLRYGQPYSFLREKQWELVHEKYARAQCQKYDVPYDGRIKNMFVYGFHDAFTNTSKGTYGVFDPAMYNKFLFMTKPEFMKKLGRPQGWGAKFSPL